MSKHETRKQFADRPEGRIRRNDRRNVQAAKRAWLAL